MEITLKALIADDHSLIREGIKHSLLNIFPGAVVFEADSGQSVIELLKEHHSFDVILLDLVMPDVNGLDLLSTI